MFFTDVWDFIFLCFEGIVYFLKQCYDVLNTTWNDIITLIFSDGWVSNLISELISVLGIDGDITVLHWLLYFTAPLFIIIAIVKFFANLRD